MLKNLQKIFIILIIFFLFLGNAKAATLSFREGGTGSYVNSLTYATRIRSYSYNSDTNKNYANEPYINIYSYDSMLISFPEFLGNNPTTQIPIGSTISSAKFYIDKCWYDGWNTDGVRLYKNTSEWKESTVTYNTRPSVSSTYQRQDIYYSLGWKNWTVTADAQYFADHPDENFGWWMYYAGSHTFGIYSDDYSNTSYRPYLSVTYTPPELPADMGYEDSLTGYWKFDETTDYIVDYARNYNNGGIYGASNNAGPSRVTGYNGTGFEFSTNYQYLGTGGLWHWDNGGVDGNTIQLWIKPYIQSLSGITTLVKLSDTLSLYLEDGKLFGMGNALSADEWVNIAVTYADNLLKLYINGEFIGSTSADPDWDDWDYVKIGGAGNNDSTTFAGIMDEVSIYERALADSEVLNVFYYGVGMESYIPEPLTVMLLSISGIGILFKSLIRKISGTD